MQKGSLWMHTAKRRMMLGSFKRDMIFISLRKSFLPMENNLQVKGEKNQNFTCTLAISFHLKGTRSTGTPGIFIGIWTEHLHSHQDGLIFCDVKQKLFIHKLLHSFCLTQVDLEEKQGAGRVRFKTWLVFYLMQSCNQSCNLHLSKLAFSKLLFKCEQFSWELLHSNILPWQQVHSYCRDGIGVASSYTL